MNTSNSDSKPIPAVLMVGTSIKTMGGISTVVKGYIDAGLFDMTPITYITTHRDGGHLVKLWAAITGLIQFVISFFSKSRPVVHIHLSSRASFWRKLPFIWIAKIAHSPVILHLHGSEFMDFYQRECGRLRKRVVRSAWSS